MMLDVEYAWRPPVCEHCKIFGHTLKSCSAQDLTEEKKKDIKETMKPVTTDIAKNDKNDGWKYVGYKRNGYRIGGFSNNGRGSFGSNRGGYMNNGGRGNRISRQYVPVKNNVRNVMDKEEGLRATKKDQGNNDSMDKINGDFIVENVSVSGNNSKKVTMGDDLSSNNRFSALNDEEDKEEKMSWTDAMLEYYLDKWKKCNDKMLTPEEVLKEEMIKYYEGVCEDIRSDKINGHFDDVVGGSNDTACFLASDEVSNIHDESMKEMKGDSRKRCRIVVGWDPFVLRARLVSHIDQVMHFEVTFLYNQLKLFVSIIYVDNVVKDRRTLWKNLIDHKTFVDNSPWVLLEDFNVLLSFDESSNYFNTRDKGMMYFKECFLNFLANKDDFIPAVSENWNVKVKGKFLKTEIERVQKRLDKDPHNSLLREEDMMYSRAYTNAILDEKKLLKQKIKIEWLTEGGHNTAYFHKVLKGRVSKSKVVTDDAVNTFYGDDVPAKFMEHFTNFFGADYYVFPIEDCYGLFTKKLDPRVASSIIRHVLDEEIKVAMFDIKDDKAAGPDGFTLKSFDESRKGFTSVAWKDICVPKSQGGLGLRSIELMNEGLMIKYLWNIISKKDSLWVKWVNSYRLKGKCVWTLSVSDNTASCWRHILKLRDKAQVVSGMLSLDLKWSRDVGIAAKVWNLPNLGLKGSYRFVDHMDIDDSFL
nr:hypothetical protein [Tanacetum cinerariifolium]